MKNQQIKMTANYVFITRDKDGEVVRTSRYKNLIPNVFRDEVAKIVGNVGSAYTLVANKMVLGDDATAVALTDTALGNETVRDDFDSRTATDSVIFLDKFFASSTVGGNTYLEAGVLTDGAAGLGGAGLLLSHVNIDETLAATETLTVSVSITINNA